MNGTRAAWKLAAARWRAFVGTYWPVVLLLPIGAAAIVALFWVLDHQTGSNLAANLPAGLLGVTVSAIVTVFIVERALRAAAGRRAQPLLKAALHVTRAHCGRCIWAFVHKCSAAVPWPGGTVDAEGAIKRLKEAAARSDSFTHLDEAERQALYDSISRHNSVLQDERQLHAIALSWCPEVDTSLIQIDDAIRAWSAYRDGEATPEEENPAICETAARFLELDSRLRTILGY